MSLTPLHFLRDKPVGYPYVDRPAYGVRQYRTDCRRFATVACDREWKVCAHSRNLAFHEWDAWIRAMGFHGACFPTRRAALDALERELNETGLMGEEYPSDERL